MPNYEIAITIVATNKTPNAPYRGAGRPEAAFVMERLIDLIAHALDLDPAAVRLANMIAPESMPYEVGLVYRDGVPVVYDSGDYPQALRQAIDTLGGLGAFRREQEAARGQGRFIGLGLGCYVEGTGAGPFEGATVRIDPSGTIFVATGACAQGQGHETVFAQIAADQWGVRPDQVTVVISDTAAIAMGYGTIASRSAVNSSSAIALASEELRRKVLAIAGHTLECDVEDLELRDGRAMVRGVPNLSMTLKEIAQAARPGWDHGRPPGMAAGLETTAYFEPPTVTWSYAAHAAIVELDRETGAPSIRKYVVVHDAGVLINPKLAEGQVVGGVCQGLGGALLEEMVYDGDAQLLTGSLVDYLLPTAADVPSIEVLHRETRSPANALGVKGLGEGGAIAPPVVIANAVCDALRPVGFELFATPLRPQALVAAMARAAEASSPLPAGERSDRARAIRVRGVMPDRLDPDPLTRNVRAERAHSDLSPAGRGETRLRRTECALAVPQTANSIDRRDRATFIELSGISKSFLARDGSTTLAVEGVDIQVGASEFVSLLGPSGCGKSTLLSIIAGLIAPSTGQVRIDGRAIRAPYTNVGIVFQSDLLLDWRTVLGNVLLQYEMRGLPAAPHMARARALIASVGLAGFETKHPWELSGGMRQRVAICRALIHEPPLLLMDEPFGALDALTRAQLQIDLQNIWQSSRKTVVFVTHSIEEAVFLSDRVIVMTPRPGRVREVIDIGLPRPRRLDVRDSPLFADAIRRVNHLFQDMGVIRG